MKSISWQTLISKRLSFFWGGLALGLAEALHFLLYGGPINISFALAQIAAAVENTFLVNSPLYGRTFEPHVDLAFIGIVCGAALVATLERQHRHQVAYPLPVLLVALLGGFLAGFGSTLAEGDTLFHLLGGVAMMQTSSLFMVALAIPIVFLALEIMAVLGVASAFQVDQARDERSGKANRPAAQPGRVKPHWLGLGAAAALLLILAGTRAGDLDWGLLLIGAIIGASVAKTGFGVEWSLLVPDSMASSPRFLGQLGLTRQTAADLRSLAPLHAWLLAILILSVAALANSTVKGFSPEIAVTLTGGRGLHIGHAAGAPLLAMGSMLMIGCEFRTYTRLGLGYATALMGVPGLLLGYLPSALWGQSITRWVESNKISTSSWLPELFSENPFVWQLVWLLFVLGLMTTLLILMRPPRQAPGAGQNS